ncbi:mucin-2 isoform X2 [Conger conger]|uniref:mucin-2 isoform X2 n=1 Tax=Conger conger TaxID=82655 RepID=UPI002A59E4B8|nr:mucin-2 isoform X2 [Conger conger]
MEEPRPKEGMLKYVEKPKEAAAGRTMPGDGVFKADFVVVGGDLDEREPGARRAQLARETTLRQEALTQLRLPAEPLTQGQLNPLQIAASSESSAYLFVNTSPAIKRIVSERGNDKRWPADARGYDTSLNSEPSPGLLLSKATDKGTTLVSERAATCSPELMETPASSRESMLSEDWFGSRVLSSDGSPASLSRTVSPCSSVRSGAFSPAVVRIRRHTLAPGSSLVWSFQPCRSPASGSPAPSPYTLSPRTSRAWQRPPPTQLTLLTAILRKGRLPVLASVQQREYCPCWPISAVSLSSCRACNAAAKLALICPGVAGRRSQTAIRGPRTPARHTAPHEPESPPLTPPPSPDSESTIFDSHESASCPDSTDCTWHRVLSLTQQGTFPSPTQQHRVPSPTKKRRLPSPTQQHGVPSLTQEHRLPSPTQQHGVPSPTQQHGVPSPTQQHGVPSTTQQHGVPSPTQQHGVPSPTQQHGVPSPTQKHGVPSPTQQHGVPSPTQQHGVPSTTQQHGVPSPTQQHGVPSPTQQHGVPSPTQQRRLPSPTQKSYSALPVSPSAYTTTAAPALPSLPFNLTPQETPPPVSNRVLSSSFLKLRSQSPCATRGNPVPSAVLTFTCNPEPTLTSTPEPKLTCSPEPKFTCTPEPKLTCTSDSKLTCSSEPKFTSTPVPKLTCTPEPKFTYTPEPKLTCTSEPKLTFTPVPKFTCTPEPKLTCTSEPKFTCTSEPKLTCSSEPKLTYTPVAKLTSTPVSKFTCTPVSKFTCTPVPKLTCTPEPKFTSSVVPRCDEAQSSPAPSAVPKLTVAQVPSCSEARCLHPLQNSIKMSALPERPRPQPPACRLSPALWTPTLSPSPCASPRSLGSLLSPLPDSHCSTPDCLSLSPSPAASSRDLLTPSPSLSPSLSPSSSPVPKSGSDRARRKRKYKIKSSYKAIAAIPTNTLLLEQQAIDEEVEKEGRPLEDVDVVRVTETHSEMCSPAQLRQQSEELYAAIDQVLQDPLPMRRSQSAPLSLVTLAEVEVPRRLTPVPRSAGRETKYAAFHLQPVGSAERTLTKPGVIRPVMVIPRLTEEEAEEDFPNPFRQQYLKEISEEQSQKFVSSPAGQLAQLAERHRESGSPTFRKGDIARNDETLLLITEKEDSGTPPMAGGASKTASFNPAQGKRQVRETHI